MEGRMKKNIYRFAFVIGCMILTAMGASLGIKAAIGVGAWDALSLSVSRVINIKVGTFSMFLNISCVLIQLALLKKEFKLTHVSQIFVSVLLGVVVNFMIYNVYSQFTIDSYYINMALLILSVLICSVAVSLIMSINLICFPLESCCMVIAERINRKFGSIRQFVDILAIVISLGLSFAFKDPITVREGTVIAMIIFGPLLDIFMRNMKTGLVKIKLMD